MADTEYHVRVEASLIGWDMSGLLTAVTEALKVSGVRSRDFGAGPVVAGERERHGHPDQVWLSFPVLGDGPEELRLVAGRVDAALTAAGVVLVSAPGVLSARPVEPVVARAKGVHYDGTARRLDIASDAGPVELLLAGPHESGQGTTVVLVSRGGFGLMEEAFVVTSVTVGGRPSSEQG